MCVCVYYINLDLYLNFIMDKHYKCKLYQNKEITVNLFNNIHFHLFLPPMVVVWQRMLWNLNRKLIYLALFNWITMGKPVRNVNVLSTLDPLYSLSRFFQVKCLWTVLKSYNLHYKNELQNEFTSDTERGS